MELATYALTPEKSRGRLYADFTNVIRSPFQRDRDRLIHSSAFRRLDGKTQGFRLSRRQKLPYAADAQH